jgi:hypothetical protein
VLEEPGERLNNKIGGTIPMAKRKKLPYRKTPKIDPLRRNVDNLLPSMSVRSKLAVTYKMMTGHPAPVCDLRILKAPIRKGQIYRLADAWPILGFKQGDEATICYYGNNNGKEDIRVLRGIKTWRVCREDLVLIDFKFPNENKNTKTT